MTAPRRALVVIDVQQQYFDGLLEIQYPPHATSLPRIVEAVDAAVAAGIPVVAVQHSSGAGAPVFDPESAEFVLRPEIESRASGDWKLLTKEYSSVFAGTDLTAWLRERDVDTVTFVGYMTNNCVLASAVEAEYLGFTIEVLADATGAIHLSNSAGSADARTVHETLMTLLGSSWARVATTDAWAAALASGAELPGSDLGSSAAAGAARAGS
jgi:nicotinamidase-related amidase